MKIIKFNGLKYLPKRQHKYDAGLDCYIQEKIIIPARQSVIIPCKFGIKLKKNECAFMCVRSSLATKLIVNNTPIDYGYKGEVHIFVINQSDNDIICEEAERIAQLVIFKIRNKSNYVFKKRLKNWNGSTGK